MLLDSDLADLYGVETRSLIQAVKRNVERFPSDFMFQLTQEEFSFLRSQIVRETCLRLKTIRDVMIQLNLMEHSEGLSELTHKESIMNLAKVKML